MAELIWSERAILDTENIYDYIANDSPTYAQLNAKSIVGSVERLQMFPESGRHLPWQSSFDRNISNRIRMGHACRQVGTKNNENQSNLSPCFILADILLTALKCISPNANCHQNHL